MKVHICCLWPRDRIARNTEDVAPVDDKYEEARLDGDHDHTPGGGDFHEMQLQC